MTRAPAFPVLVIPLLLFGCGGGGGGPTAPPAPGPGISLISDGAGANSISLQRGGGSTADLLVVEVTASQVADVYGVAFDLRFPGQLLSFEAAEEAAFLDESGTVATTLQVVEVQAGSLVIGLTRLGDVGGRSGNGVLLTLQFRSLGAGSGRLSYDNNAALDPSGGPQGDVTWSGASVEVRL